MKIEEKFRIDFFHVSKWGEDLSSKYFPAEIEIKDYICWLTHNYGSDDNLYDLFIWSVIIEELMKGKHHKSYHVEISDIVHDNTIFTYA